MKSITFTKENPNDAKGCYKRKFDNHFRLNNEESNHSDQFYIHVDIKGDMGPRSKLALVRNGPFSVKKVDIQYKTIVLEHLDRRVENASRNCEVLAMKTRTKPDILTKAQPMKLMEIDSDYKIVEEENVRYINKLN